MEGEDLYEILGITKSTSPEEIKKAYYRLARSYHPDRNPTVTATEKFQAIGKAYQILIDPKKKSIYDRSGEFSDSLFTSSQDRDISIEEVSIWILTGMIWLSISIFDYYTTIGIEWVILFILILCEQYNMPRTERTSLSEQAIRIGLTALAHLMFPSSWIAKFSNLVVLSFGALIGLNDGSLDVSLVFWYIAIFFELVIRSHPRHLVFLGSYVTISLLRSLHFKLVENVQFYSQIHLVKMFQAVRLFYWNPFPIMNCSFIALVFFVVDTIIKHLMGSYFTPVMYIIPLILFIASLSLLKIWRFNVTLLVFYSISKYLIPLNVVIKVNYCLIWGTILFCLYLIQKKKEIASPSHTYYILFILFMTNAYYSPFEDIKVNNICSSTFAFLTPFTLMSLISLALKNTLHPNNIIASINHHAHT